MTFLKNIKSIFNPKINGNIWANEELLEFRENLLQVITWTSQLSKNFDFEKGTYGTVFRQTNPLLKELPFYQFGKQSNEIHELKFDIDFGEDYSSLNNWDYTFDDCDFILKEAMKSRIESEKYNLLDIDKLGRILSFQTCVSTSDGAPIIESQNFVDETDIPPIDTWFYLKRNYYHSDSLCNQTLFCWIPKQFEKVMQKAIDVEILDSYRWFDENDNITFEQIRNIS